MMIIQRVWGYNEGGNSGLVKAHMHHLRQKIERDPNVPQFVVTVQGAGYTFAASFVE